MGWLPSDKALFVASCVGLALGGVLRLAAGAGPADGAWAATTAVVAFPVGVRMARDAWNREPGVDVIGRYFPEYPAEMRQRFS